jgi:hypothetical protein
MTETRVLQERFAWFLQSRYRLSPADVEVVPEARGYWRRREPCGGRGVCREPSHSFMFYEGGTKHTIRYVDEVARDARGRFLSPYLTWCLAVEGSL